jgi:hypothetical protein
MYLYPEDVDRRLNWPLGRAERLARRGRLPHVVLPDSSVRFEWESVQSLIQRIPAALGEDPS